MDQATGTNIDAAVGRDLTGARTTWRSALLASVVACVAATGAALPAMARDGDHNHTQPNWNWQQAPSHGGASWRDHDIHHFQAHDLDHWRGGRWFHGRHDGRDAWWWIVDGAFYAYNGPVYPYPDPYQPPAVAAPAVGQNVWYYCQNPAGYYPYVAECPGGWQPVPAQPQS